MVVLGDLGRYWQLHIEQGALESRDWTNCIAYYSRALTLQPNDGKVHT